MLFAPVRALFRAVLPLQMEPADDSVGAAEYLSGDQLCAAFQGKHVIIVGGTKGIGRSIADVLREAGAKVIDVGRSAAPPDGVAADLSTASGCHALADALEAKGVAPFDHLIFTAGLWPNLSSPYTSDGVDKVLAVDLLARHIVLTQLAARGLLTSGCCILSVLAASQRFPISSDPHLLKQTLSSFVVDARDGAPPPPRQGARAFVQSLCATSLAHDVWLAHMGRSGALPPDTRLLATFPGILVSELARSAFPALLVPLLQLAMAPIADPPETMGRNHASLLAAAPAVQKRVSYWAAPLLHARHPTTLAADTALGAWVAAFLDGLAARGAPASKAATDPDAMDRGTLPEDVVVPKDFCPLGI